MNERRALGNIADEEKSDLALEGVKESAVTRTEQIFLRMDVDKNGVITENEFIQGCLQDKFLQQIFTADYSEGI